MNNNEDYVLIDWMIDDLTTLLDDDKLSPDEKETVKIVLEEVKKKRESYKSEIKNKFIDKITSMKDKIYEDIMEDYNVPTGEECWDQICEEEKHIEDLADSLSEIMVQNMVLETE